MEGEYKDLDHSFEMSSRRGEKRPNESKSGTNQRLTSGSRTGQEATYSLSPNRLSFLMNEGLSSALDLPTYISIIGV